jgi:hypothetical protein
VAFPAEHEAVAWGGFPPKPIRGSADVPFVEPVPLANRPVAAPGARRLVVTIASKRYLALARVTAASFLEHHPDTEFVLLLADTEDGRVDAHAEPFSRIVPLRSLALPEPERFCFGYTELELSYALTPWVIDHLLEEGAASVIFLKQETLVLGSLEPLWQGLERHSALVTPHFLEPPRRPDALTWEVKVLLAGVFNGGVIGFARCEESRRFLAWWKEKTRRRCVHDVGSGIHFEQRWLDFLPTLMPGHGVVRDPGINVGHWNLPDRRLELRDGRFTACGVPLRVIRFSGYEPDRPERVTKHHEAFPVASTGVAARIFARYHDLLMQHGHRDARELPYAFSRFDDGAEIPEAMRRLYREQEEPARRFGNPFEASAAKSFRRFAERRLREAAA